MRHETQHWNQIRLYVEVVEFGAPVPGLNPQALIKRVSDGLGYDPGAAAGSRWVATPAPVTLAEDSALPGVYGYELPVVDIDFAEQMEGYIVQYRSSAGTFDGETGTPPEEPEFVESARIVTDFTGDELFRILALRQNNMRQVNLSYHATGRPETGTIQIYANSSDAASNVSPIGSYSFEATYDVSGRLTSYLSTKIS